jgi:hypothetical protein
VYVEYNEVHWKLLGFMRARALRILSKLEEISQTGFVYGSLARGDVNRDSDIDVVVLNPNVIVLDLLEVNHKFIVQATPTSTPKAYLSLDPEEREVISFPLSKLKRHEEDFYRFGGMVSRKDIEDKVRVPGVNKKLELIVPIPEGHVQLPLLGNEDVAVKYLGISIASLTLRERLLNRRREKGRTGVFLRYDLSRDESIEGAVRDLSKNNKFFRRSVGD